MAFIDAGGGPLPMSTGSLTGRVRTNLSASAPRLRLVVSNAGTAIAAGTVWSAGSNIVPSIHISTEGVTMPSVDVATVGRVASGIVFLICIASFLIGRLTGFDAIFPPISLLVAAMAALMHAISVLLKRQWRK